MIKLKTLLSENIDTIKYIVSILKSDPTAFGVSEKDMPNMDNWGLRTRDQEPYIIVVKALDNNKLVGKAMFGYWGKGSEFIKADSVYVIPSHRTRGIANTMYDKAQEKIKGNILPSPYQTPGGKGLWKKRLK